MAKKKLQWVCSWLLYQCIFLKKIRLILVLGTPRGSNCSEKRLLYPYLFLFWAYGLCQAFWLTPGIIWQEKYESVHKTLISGKSGGRNGCSHIGDCSVARIFVIVHGSSTSGMQEDVLIWGYRNKFIGLKYELVSICHVVGLILIFRSRKTPELLSFRAF